MLELLILLVIGYLSARPVLNTVRAWQARRHAYKAYALIDQEKWGDARAEAIAAYQLRASESEAIRAVARLLSRAGQSDGLKFWHELETESKLTRADLRDEAGLALRTREFGLADKAIKELLGNRDGGPTPVDWLLAADLADFGNSNRNQRQPFRRKPRAGKQVFDAMERRDAQIGFIDPVGPHRLGIG